MCRLIALTPTEKIHLNEWYYSFNDCEVELSVDENETEQELTDRLRKRLLETIGHKYLPD